MRDLGKDDSSGHLQKHPDSGHLIFCGENDCGYFCVNCNSEGDCTPSFFQVELSGITLDTRCSVGLNFCSEGSGCGAEDVFDTATIQDASLEGTFCLKQEAPNQAFGSPCTWFYQNRVYNDTALTPADIEIHGAYPEEVNACEGEVPYCVSKDFILTVSIFIDFELGSPTYLQKLIRVEAWITATEYIPDVFGGGGYGAIRFQYPVFLGQTQLTTQCKDIDVTIDNVCPIANPLNEFASACCGIGHGESGTAHVTVLSTPSGDCGGTIDPLPEGGIAGCQPPPETPLPKCCIKWTAQNDCNGDGWYLASRSKPYRCSLTAETGWVISNLTSPYRCKATKITVVTEKQNGDCPNPSDITAPTLPDTVCGCGCPTDCSTCYTNDDDKCGVCLCGFSGDYAYLNGVPIPQTRDLDNCSWEGGTDLSATITCNDGVWTIHVNDALGETFNEYYFTAPVIGNCPPENGWTFDVANSSAYEGFPIATISPFFDDCPSCNHCYSVWTSTDCVVTGSIGIGSLPAPTNEWIDNGDDTFSYYRDLGVTCEDCIQTLTVTISGTDCSDDGEAPFDNTYPLTCQTSGDNLFWETGEGIAIGDITITAVDDYFVLTRDGGASHGCIWRRLRSDGIVGSYDFVDAQDGKTCPCGEGTPTATVEGDMPDASPCPPPTCGTSKCYEKWHGVGEALTTNWDVSLVERGCYTASEIAAHISPLDPSVIGSGWYDVGVCLKDLWREVGDCDCISEATCPTEGEAPTAPDECCLCH